VNGILTHGNWLDQDEASVKQGNKSHYPKTLTGNEARAQLVNIQKPIQSKVVSATVKPQSVILWFIIFPS
jgi:hypothetical protein